MTTTAETLDINEEEDGRETNGNTEFLERKRRISDQRYTEHVDTLLVQNKKLQKEIAECDNIIVDLEKKLVDNKITISKNLFYIGLIALAYFMYAGNKNFVEMKTSLSANTAIMQSYKGELEKSRKFNESLIQRLEEIDKVKR